MSAPPTMLASILNTKGEKEEVKGRVCWRRWGSPVCGLGQSRDDAVR